MATRKVGLEKQVEELKKQVEELKNIIHGQSDANNSNNSYSSSSRQQMNQYEISNILSLIKEDEDNFQESIQRSLKTFTYQKKINLWEIAQSNPSITWDYNDLDQHPIIIWEIIQANHKAFKNQVFLKDVKKLDVARKKTNLWKIVQANPNAAWDYGDLDRYPDIVWEVIQANYNSLDFCLYE